jgi:hypothetical protein
VQEAKGRCIFEERTTFPSPFTRRTPLLLDCVVGWKSMAQQVFFPGSFVYSWQVRKMLWKIFGGSSSQILCSGGIIGQRR